MSIFVLALIFLGGMAVFFVLLGLFTPGNGADLVDWDPIAMAEKRLERRLQDQDDLLRLTNEKRGDRGLPELTRQDLIGEEPPL